MFGSSCIYDHSIKGSGIFNNAVNCLGSVVFVSYIRLHCMKLPRILLLNLQEIIPDITNIDGVNVDSSVT